MMLLWHAATVLVGLLVLAGLASALLGLLAARRHFARPNPPALPQPALRGAADPCPATVEHHHL